MPEETEPSLLDLTRAVADDVKKTVLGELGPQPLNELVDEIYELATTLSRRLEETAPAERRRLPVCQAGCDSCCRMHHVFVTPFEILRLAAHLRATRTPEALAELARVIDEVAPKLATMTLQERARSRLPCVLLDAQTGACTVHAVRPLLCRGYNSTDADVCRAAYQASDLTTPPPGNFQQAAAHRHVFAGLVLAGESLGVEAGPYELTNALRVVLGSPDAEERWKQAESVFAGASTRVSRDHEPGWLAWSTKELARQASGGGEDK